MNGTPACADAKFQNGLLRDQWKWGGVDSSSPLSPYIVSDCHAIGDMTKTCNCSHGCSTPDKCTSSYMHPGHGYSTTDAGSVRDALRGGTEANCGCYYKKFFNQSLADGLINDTDVDRAAGRLVNAMIRLGQLDEEGMTSEYTNVSMAEVDSAKHRQLALEAAQQSIVLLKNDPALLPLKPGTRVALIGPHANSSLAMLSEYHGDNVLVTRNSPLDAAKADASLVVTYALGVNSTGNNDTSGIAEAAGVCLNISRATQYASVRRAVRHDEAFPLKRGCLCFCARV